MSNLILVRHGQSKFNLERRFTGFYDVELTSKGISKFSHTSSNLQYYIATEQESTFGG